MSAEDERQLVAALRAGDEAQFEALVERLHPRLLRLCRKFVSTDSAAEDIVQDTWSAVLQGLDEFDGRSSLETWVRHIAANRARTRYTVDARTELAADDDVLADRFHVSGLWKMPPTEWPFACSPEASAEYRQLVELVDVLLNELPPLQRLVVTLRDVEAMTGPEVCSTLELSEENQRVLLHRGRTKLRALLEQRTRGLSQR